MTIASAFLYFIQGLVGFFIWGFIIYIPLYVIIKKMKFGKIR